MATTAEVGALLRQDFPSFLRKAFATLEPGRTLADNWHIDAMAHHLDLVRDDRLKRLMINVPPRSLKSFIVSVAWPAFLLGHDPGLQIMVVSHGFDLATDLHNRFRKLVEADWYRAAFPTMRAAPDKDTDRVFKTSRGGHRMAVSVEGSVTGLGADLIILDDPVDASDADDAAACGRVNNWVDTVLMSRRNDPARTPLVGVMQRLSVFDAAAHLQAKEAWTRLVLPAIAETDMRVAIGDDRRHAFRRGQALHAARLGPKELGRLRDRLGEATFLAQYQQRPVPGGGGVIDVSKFGRWTRRPRGWDRIFISVDAASGSDSGSWSVLQTWCMSDGRLYLLDSSRGRWAFPELRRRVIELQARKKANHVVVEYASSGQALLEELWLHYPPDTRREIVQKWTPRHSKEVRMDKAMVEIERGRVLLPHSADWLPALIDELQAFPNGAHDDQADALSQAVEVFRQLMDRLHPPPERQARAYLLG